MKTVRLAIAIGITVVGVGLVYYFFIKKPSEVLYVAVEGDGVIAAVDTAKQAVFEFVDLSVEHAGGILRFFPHNVQVAPDNESVWVTANAGTHEGHSFAVPRAYAHGPEEEADAEPDEVIVINPRANAIIQRIPIAVGIHLAHVVLSPDGAMAYVTAQKEGALYEIDAATFKVRERFALPAASEPHGLRMSPDGRSLYIAMLGERSLRIFDTETKTFSVAPLGGQAVQAGITPDGQFAVASLYDTKQLAIYDTQTKKTAKIALPASARGPIQMYPTPDSRFMYLADQGYYFSEPVGDRVYKIDIKKRTVVKEIQVGRGAHGVVVSPDGKFVYVSNLLSGDVSVIDAATDEEVVRVDVGQEPNGVSVWIRGR